MSTQDYNTSTQKFPCSYCGKVECGIRSYDKKPFELCPTCNELFKAQKIAYCSTGKHYYPVISQNSPSPSLTTDCNDPRKNWETSYRCSDGHYVRSKSEVIIDDWLYNNNIVHCYEKKCIVPFNNEIMLCDFYIPSRDLYIEYWGKTDKDYVMRRKEKEEMYKTMGKSLLSLEDSDIMIIEDVLMEALFADRRKNSPVGNK